MSEAEVLTILGNPIAKVKSNYYFLDEDSTKVSYDFCLHYSQPDNGSEEYYVKTIELWAGKVVGVKDSFYME